MAHSCKGMLRTPKGNRLLELLATDRSHPEIKNMIILMRAKMPCCEGLTDRQVMDAMEVMIAEIPKQCPDCTVLKD